MRVRGTQRCRIAGCRAPAAVWLEDRGASPYNGLPLCADHARSIRDQAVAEALADPEIRRMLGLAGTVEREG